MAEINEHMNIYLLEPTTWRDLQLKVAEVLKNIGYECEIEKNVQTIREKINIDVYAEKLAFPSNIILCECKYWRKNVPKTIVHSFRTVLSDFGANYGFIISKKGFQSGAYVAVKNTNVKLLNWNEFQLYFKEAWLTNMISKTSIANRDLYNYVTVGLTVIFKKEYNDLSQEDLERYHHLEKTYFDAAFYSVNVDGKNINTHQFDLELFNFYVNKAQQDFDMTFSCYNEYFNSLVEKCNEGLKEFDDLFKEKLRRI